MPRINTLEAHVRAVLAQDEESRNDDVRLTVMIWFKYHRSSMMKGTDDLWYVAVKKLKDLPREDNVKRVRAKIQNVEHQFLPTRPEVAKKRGWEIDKWRGYLGYPVAGVDNQHL